MSFLENIAVLILTYNEASNIGRTLEALRQLPEIVVLDSYSSDETAQIVSQYSNTRLVRRAFDSHANQWNHGLTACDIGREWVLALDADYVLTASLIEEIAALAPPETVSGYRISFNYCVLGKRLSASLYPPVVALFRRQRSHYEQSGHTQRLILNGFSDSLSQRIDHDDRKPLSRWIVSQQRYAELEVEHLFACQRSELRRTDRIRLMGWPAPILVFFHTLVAKRCIVSGLPGWYYVLQRTLAEILIALEIAERRLRSKA